jgi:hypothetical protein
MPAATYKGTREMQISAECLRGELVDKELWHAAELMDDVVSEIKYRVRVAYMMREADEVDAQG